MFFPQPFSSKTGTLKVEHASDLPGALSEQTVRGRGAVQPRRGHTRQVQGRGHTQQVQGGTDLRTRVSEEFPEDVSAAGLGTTRGGWRSQKANGSRGGRKQEGMEKEGRGEKMWVSRRGREDVETG